MIGFAAVATSAKIDQLGENWRMIRTTETKLKGTLKRF